MLERRSRLGDWGMDTVHGRGNPAALKVVDARAAFVRIGQISRVGAQEILPRTTYILRHEPLE